MTQHNDTIAIAHKDYDVRGGGERLAEELARTFDAPMHVGRRDPAKEPSNHDLDIREIDLDRWQRHAIDHGGIARSIAYWSAWGAADLADYDTVVTSGNEPLWRVGPDTQTVVAYTHSTPRFDYDLEHESDSSLGAFVGAAKRTLYQHNVTRPDLWVANSDLVARRVRKYWNIPDDQLRVVYPPVETTQYTPGDAATEDRVYLYLGRVCDHKRVDEIVEAARSISGTVTIAGTGPAVDRLSRVAPPNVEFLGYVSERRKRDLMASASALLYPPANEDFGMVPIEALAAGTPVIAVDEGFPSFVVEDGANGLLYDRGEDNLRQAIDRFERDGVDWSPQRLSTFATESFGVQQFRAGMRQAVAEAQRRSRVEADLFGDAPAGAEPATAVATDGGEDA